MKILMILKILSLTMMTRKVVILIPKMKVRTSVRRVCLGTNLSRRLSVRTRREFVGTRRRRESEIRSKREGD